MADVRAEPPIVISVVIPAYNAEKYIARAVGSVLKQTRRADEIIVIDDGSTDGTADAVRSFGDRVRLIQQPNAGVSAARNAGIRAAAGNWIAFLDADDEWLLEFIQKQREIIQRNPDVAWGAANYITCACGENRQAPYVTVEQVNRRMQNSEVIHDYFRGFADGLWGCSDTVFARAEVFHKAGVFDTTLRKGEDLDTWWRIAYHYPKFMFIGEPMAIYHLGVPCSGKKKFQTIEHYIDLITRHMQLSQQYNCRESFKLVADKLYRGWMRALLFSGDKRAVRSLHERSRYICPAWYRCLIWMLTVFPGVTQKGCYLVSKVVRALHLRRRVVAPPAKNEC